MKYFCKSDIGLLRNENQDRVWVSSLGENEEAVVMVVCDGMGGENAGSVASQMTIDLIKDRIENGFRLSN
ncbi:MAG: serine/threonine-protein phosphatase, partial [Ruminiclostridium sp.]|nr:serine/threonine-protein phosphatase [Ruminiclostridium sp.]